jgi:aryl-alcohol dehydrogenase-like predicted oxidoreductase
MRTGKIKAIDGTIEMSKIVLGASNYGSEITKECSFEIMDKYYEIGGRAIDTGRIYASYIRNGSSKSEKTVGQWIKERNVRKEFIVVTKGGHPEYSDIHRSRLAPECLEYDINTSLAVLDMDYVDIYFLHRDDKDVPVSEIMDTLDTFVKDGKTPFTVSQIQWNMAYCRQEDMLDNTCLCMTDEEYKGYLNSNIPVMAYSPQAIGFFSKYIENGGINLSNRAKVFLNDINIKRVKKVKTLCEEFGCTPAALAISYITSNPLEGFAIIGNVRMEHLMDSLNSIDLELDNKTMEWLMEI